jgi:hypothetical protein
MNVEDNSSEYQYFKNVTFSVYGSIVYIRQVK